MGDIFISELIGSAILILLGGGVVANVLLPKTGGNGGGTLMINWGWGLAVFAGVYAAYASGGHLNPAVTLAVAMNGGIGWDQVPVYLAGEFLGCFIGAVLVWLAYKEHFDACSDADTKRGIFCTAPGIRSLGWNLVTEIIATVVLILWVLVSGYSKTGLGPAGVALLVVGIGASLGGPTGYAINPARDLAPRIAHALLPIKNKADGNWGYAWVPVVGPIIGALIAFGIFKIMPVIPVPA